MKNPDKNIIVVASPQGGSGKSTIAVNLAIHYARQSYRVLLMDMECYGSAPAMMNIPIRGKGLSSLITALEQSEDIHKIKQFNQLFSGAVYIHPELANLHILLGAPALKMESLSSVYTSFLMEFSKEENYDMIIIDTSSELCERNIACIEGADLILIPALQDVSCGWKLVQFKEILDELNIPKEKISLLINRCSKHSTFNNKEFEKELGYSILGEISDLTNAAYLTAHRGIPLIDSKRKSASKVFRILAAQILEKVGS